MASTPLDFAGDLSVERRWRDSEVAAGGPASPRRTEDLQRSARSDNCLTRGVGWSRRGDVDGGDYQKPHITVTTGGGGPTVAPGSYAEIFMAMQRRERSISTVNNDVAAAASTATITTNKATPTAGFGTKNKEFAAHHHKHQAGHDDGASQVAVAAALAHVESVYHSSRRANAPAAPDTGARADALARARDATSIAPASVPTSSLLSYRGMSRAERGAARRQAWSQARQEGALGDAGIGAHRHQRRSTSFRKATKAAVGGGDALRSKRVMHRGRSLEPTVSSALGRSSVSRGHRWSSHTEEVTGCRVCSLWPLEESGAL